MVKQKNYNHRELAVLPKTDVERMKEIISKPTKEQQAE